MKKLRNLDELHIQPLHKHRGYLCRFLYQEYDKLSVRILHDIPFYFAESGGSYPTVLLYNPCAFSFKAQGFIKIEFNQMFLIQYSSVLSKSGDFSDFLGRKTRHLNNLLD